jgi:hypothetical protein
MSVKPLQLPAHDPKVKKIILEGISILQSQSNPNVAKVAQELTATHGAAWHRLPLTTLSIAVLMAALWLPLMHIFTSSTNILDYTQCT